MSEVSQNGWVTLRPGDPRLATWTIPDAQRRVTLRRDYAGFVLACWVLWFDRRIEKLNDGSLDEGGHNYRKIGKTETWSNHASATAVDLNWRKHPLGAVGTFPQKVRTIAGEMRASTAIRWKLNRWGNVIKWGGDYKRVKDEMHFEISDVNGSQVNVRKLALKLYKTKVGRDILAANSWYKM